ncbi:MAG: SDR family NAD(P)-dependent oxidoreductase [Caulobacteraceae bacterium]
MATDLRPLAVVTGASSGIGYELAKQFAEHGFDLVLAADMPELSEAAQAIRALGCEVETVQADLSTEQGVRTLYDRTQALGRPVDALAANAGIGLGKGFLDQPIEKELKVVDTNISGTLRLIHLIARDMRERGRGRILITGSIAGLIPGTFQAVYNGTKAFLDSFSFALRNELKDTGVTVTALLPGATETEFFERGELMDTKIGQAKKDDPADVAKTGFDALMRGEGDVVHGIKNKLQAAAAAVIPGSQLAQMHRGMAEPGSGEK